MFRLSCNWLHLSPCSFVLTHSISFFQVHSNNRYTQGVRVFSKVECSFKPGILQPWTSPTLTLAVPLEDLKDPSSRIIAIPLGGRPAQILRCKFYFADSWLLISEIAFLTGRKLNSSFLGVFQMWDRYFCSSGRQLFCITATLSVRSCGDLTLPKQ